MELEPDFSRLSFDMDLSEFDRRPQSLATANYSRVFNGSSQAAMTGLLSANDSHPDCFFGLDSSLFELSSFFGVDGLSVNNFGSAAEIYRRGFEQNTCPLNFDPRTSLNEYEIPMDASVQHLVDAELEAEYSRPERNGPLDTSECTQEHSLLPGSSQPGCQSLDFADFQPTFTSLGIPNEYNPIDFLSYTCSNEDGNFTHFALNPDGTADTLVGIHHSEGHGDTGGSDLCVRPEVLTLPASTPNHQDSQDNQELLRSIDIDSCPDLASSRPVPIFNDLIVNFDLNPKPPPSKRKRSSFTRAGKEKVSLVREWGACTFCRSRKVSCSATEVCVQCRRTVDDPVIAKQICLRTRIQDIYIGVKELHGPSLKARKERLQPYLTSLDGIPQDVRLSLQVEIESYRSTAELNVRVMRCTNSPKGRWKSLKKARGIYITSNSLKEKRYVIMPSSLPGTDDLDTFGRDILLMSAGSLSGNMTRLLDGFLSCYCNGGGPSRLRHLSNLTLRMASLNNFVAYGFLNLQDGSYDLLGRLNGTDNDSEKFISETVHDQIRIRAAEGLEPAEKHVFSELDNLPKIVGASNHARIIAGICLLRCLLLYRDRLIRDQIRLELPGTKPYHQPRLDKSAFMYRRLTVAFGTLCREQDCPLTMTWEDEENQDVNGSEELKTLFSQLRCAFRQFCRDNLTSQYDDIFRSLISEPIKNRKTRKRRRIAT
ncbi:hypothetical protein N431DRAFT_372459 [Stipitochalara longipes BDJ]|nr:hypothetical protein N431DRAFT_372459 [Stipitochalara longipes BDJ]